jgi:hypothetical protein
MRRLSALAVPAVAGALLATMLPASAANAAKYVPAPLFGQHVASIASGKPATLPKVGAIRLWDAGVSWRDL